MNKQPEPFPPHPRLTLTEGVFISNETLAAMTERLERLEAQVDALEAHVREIRPTILRTEGVILKGVAD